LIGEGLLLSSVQPDTVHKTRIAAAVKGSTKGLIFTRIISSIIARGHMRPWAIFVTGPLFTVAAPQC
jgi:hypothetical protein